MCGYYNGSDDSIGVWGGGMVITLQEAEMLLEVDNHDGNKADRDMNVLSE